MANKELKIYGAGIAGLLAGCAFQNATIFEAGSAEQAQHKAVLRFRSSAVGDSVGIDFRKVVVHKGLWYNGKFVEPNIQLANFYSDKVVSKLADRSIWNLHAVERFIAPEDFVAQLAERCGDRVQWNTMLQASDILPKYYDGSDAEQQQVPAISTLPLSMMATMWEALCSPSDPLAMKMPSFEYANITVKRFRVQNSDVFQTVYFPAPNTRLYRASITGDLLIAEFVGTPENETDWMMDVVQAFGLNSSRITLLESTKQRYGKIGKIDDAWRKQFILRMSNEFNIFSLGRFGTWRNLLLDDVLKDISVIKRLLNASGYERHVASALS